MNRAIVVMGVSGSGKSTLARALAAELHWTFVEGDTLHSAGSIEKMRSGMPLSDADRGPWLERIAAAIAEHRVAGVVVSCSALKRAYRDTIGRIAGEVLYVLPQLDRAALQRRLAQRPAHFMPAALLDSQLATLEMPGADERAIVVDGARSTDELVRMIRGVLNE